MKKVFLDELPKYIEGEGVRVGAVKWHESINYRVPFIYKDVQGDVLIKSYIKEKQRLIIEYNGIDYEIKTGNLINCKLGKIVGKITRDYKLEIGEFIDKEEKTMLIIDKEIRIKKQFDNSRGKLYESILKYYKYKCSKCDNEEWMEESSAITKKTRCNVCTRRKAKLGYSTIYDESPWMIDLGVSEEDAKSYSPKSNKPITVKCPNCGKSRQTKISYIYSSKSIGCRCGDGFSYGHKYIYNLLKQLNLKFKDNVKLDWCNFYNKYKERNYKGEYDFVIENEKLIIEVDGEFHRKDNSMSGQTVEESKFIDSEKDRLAIENGYEIIRIFYDSNKLDISDIQKLDIFFDLSKIDWLECEKYALTNNKISEICNYWNNKQVWETVYNLESVFNIDRYTITRYLKKGTKLGWCNYDPKEEFNKSRIVCGQTRAKELSKEVEIFKDGQSLGVFESCRELARQSEKLFGTKMCDSKISSVCNGKRKTHKGFTFKYTEQLNNENQGVA